MGTSGDDVQFVRSETMELIGNQNQITAIRPYDKMKYREPVSSTLLLKILLIQLSMKKSGFGIENLTWTPEVLFAGNTIRNNRARGTLFSTPKKRW